MATNVATLTAKITADTTGLKAGLTKAERQVEKFGKNTNKDLAAIGKKAKLAALAGAAAVTAVAVKSVAAFADFEQGMNEVFTLLPDISGEAMGEMEGQVKDLATEFGVLPDKVVPALYQALSAGVPKDNVFEFMETATKAAIGGATELETAVDGLTSVVNAYGAENIDAAEASDLMFTSVRLGKTTMDELSRSLFQVNPVAAAMGVEFRDITAALAAMTAQGTPTRVATTQLRQALVELGKEGTVAFDAFKTATGQTFPDFVSSGGNVEQAFQAMKTQADQMGVGVGDLFGSVEAGMGVISLTSESGAAAFSTAMQEMIDSAGATDQAFETMDTGLTRSFDRIKATVATAFIDIGAKLAPMIEDVAGWFEDELPAAIDKTMAALDTAIGLVGDFTTGAGAILTFFADMPSLVDTAAIALGGLGAAIALAMGHPVVAAVLAVGTAVTMAGQQMQAQQIHAEGLRDAVRDVDSVSREFFTNRYGARRLGIGEGALNELEALGFTLDDVKTAIKGTEEEWDDFYDAATRATGGSLLDMPQAIGLVHQLRTQVRDTRIDMVSDLGAMRSWMEMTGTSTDDMIQAWVGPSGVELMDKRMQRSARGIRDSLGDVGDELGDSGDDFKKWEKEVSASTERAAEIAETSIDDIISVFKKAPKQIELSVKEMVEILSENLAAQARFESVMTALGEAGLYALQRQLVVGGPSYTAAMEKLLTDAANGGEAAFAMNFDLSTALMSAMTGMSTSQIGAEIGGLLARGVEAGFNPNLTAPTVGVSRPRFEPRAAGGPVTAGNPYVVGEEGPEMFVPNRSGTIVPNSQSGSTINVYVDRVETDDLPGDVAEGMIMASIQGQVNQMGDW